ncbi:MAG: iron-sulfur cluster assembly accessory protein [Chromatiales bacterium]|nr:iron-sulfur cluster assembly accessory protein [Chromatiales bacterium]
MSRDDSTIKITDAAAHQIQQSLKPQEMKAMSLRLAIMRNTDGSFHYAMGLDDQNYEDDLKLQSNNINIVVNSAMLGMLRGMTIDYVELEKEQYKFIFLNPNDPSYIPPTDTT